jgi:hypothetical protein
LSLATDKLLYDDYKIDKRILKRITKKKTKQQNHSGTKIKRKSAQMLPIHTPYPGKEKPLNGHTVHLLSNWLPRFGHVAENE